MCKFKQIYKNVPGIGFFSKAGRPFAKRMEPNKFVDTNLLINLDPLKIGKCVSKMIKVGLRSNRYSHSVKIMKAHITNWLKYAIHIVKGILNFMVKSCKTIMKL